MGMRHATGCSAQKQTLDRERITVPGLALLQSTALLLLPGCGTPNGSVSRERTARLQLLLLMGTALVSAK
jgi:hypothetical protein